MINDVVKILSSCRLPLNSEKELQDEIEKEFIKNRVIYDREYRLDNKNIIDFIVNKDIGIEVKIKASAKSIYRQCERYCGFNTINKLIVITNRSLGFPEEINKKACYIINIGQNWL